MSLLTSITYTHHEVSNGRKYIEFVYEDRDDELLEVYGHEYFHHKKRIKEIRNGWDGMSRKKKYCFE